MIRITDKCPTCSDLSDCLKPGKLNAVIPAKELNQLRFLNKDLLEALQGVCLYLEDLAEAGYGDLNENDKYLIARATINKAKGI